MVQSDTVVQRSMIRNILMKSFHLLVHTLGVQGIKDTQCGFKLFTRNCAQKIFGNLHIKRWAFDIELLLLANMLSIDVIELPVSWTEIDGSKMTLLIDAPKMARDLTFIRMAYFLGIWKTH